LDTEDLISFLKKYITIEDVEVIVFGWPAHKDGTPTEITKDIIKLERQIKKWQDSIELQRVDESYTSVEAKQIILQQGVKKSKRRNKALTDKVSAMVILKRYLNK